MRRLLTYLLLFINYTSTSQSSKQEIVDSIDYYIEACRDTEREPEERLQMGERAIVLAKQINEDTLVLRSRRYIAVVYEALDQWEDYKTYNIKNLELATKLKDTYSLAVAYNNLGWHYYRKKTNDSAYYYFSKSIVYYKNVRNYKYSINLSTMADLQGNTQDYIGAEKNIILAIEALKDIEPTEDVLDQYWILYNNLGVISRKQGLYDTSINYHKKALEVTKGISFERYNKSITYNNMAGVYKNQKDYSRAIKIYEDLIRNRSDYDKDDPTFYPLILANLAETKSLANYSDVQDIKQMFGQAYKLANSFKDPYTKMGVAYQTAKFHYIQQEQDSALKYTKEALSLAKQMNENTFTLEMLLQLSKLETGDKSKTHLYEYITLSDSLLVKERNARNKFARIRYETDQLEAENVQIGKERSLFLYLFMGSLLGLGLLYIIIVQRNKNKVLKYEADQQEYSQELYDLMLAQQQQLEKGRTQERMRVAEELHDGILGKLFGARMNLGFLKVDTKTEDDFNGFVKELQHIEKDIRTLSHELKQDAIPLDVNYLDIINELIASYQKLLPFTIDINIDNTIVWETLDEGVKLQVYRILQEALTNIIKHSEATEVTIHLDKKENTLELTIKDNGKGFKETTTKGIGIKNMQSRAKRLKGQFTIESTPEKGAKIEVYLPLKKN